MSLGKAGCVSEQILHTQNTTHRRKSRSWDSCCCSPEYVPYVKKNLIPRKCCSMKLCSSVIFLEEKKKTFCILIFWLSLTLLWKSAEEDLLTLFRWGKKKMYSEIFPEKEGEIPKRRGKNPLFLLFRSSRVSSFLIPHPPKKKWEKKHSTQPLDSRIWCNKVQLAKKKYCKVETLYVGANAINKTLLPTKWADANEKNPLFSQ